MNSDGIMLKLIKEYLLNNPYATARQISEHFIVNNFGVRQEYNISKISRLISTYGKSTKEYRWFNVDIIKKKGKTTYVVRK